MSGMTLFLTTVIGKAERESILIEGDRIKSIAPLETARFDEIHCAGGTSLIAISTVVRLRRVFKADKRE